jgi:hypothetical protein
MTSRAVVSTRAVSTPAEPRRRAAGPLLPDPPSSSIFFPPVLLVCIDRVPAPASGMEAGAKPRATARLLVSGE